MTQRCNSVKRDGQHGVDDRFSAGTYLALPGGDADRIGNHKSGHLFLNRNDICKSDNNLCSRIMSVRQIGQGSRLGAHVGNPAKDVGMKGQMVFGNVNPSLHQDILLQRASVI